jgi:hypothetical protein
MIWLGLAIGTALLIIATGLLARPRARDDVDVANVDQFFTKWGSRSPGLELPSPRRSGHSCSQ